METKVDGPFLVTGACQDMFSSDLFSLVNESNHALLAPN